MDVTFWGVRGSIPSPGPAPCATAATPPACRFACRVANSSSSTAAPARATWGSRFWTGPFGKGKGSATLLLSHAHWDHIQGFPFFGPFYVPGNRFTVYGGSRGERLVEDVL